MKCEIYRTSDWAGCEKPCKRAYKDISDNGIVTEWYIDINSIDDIQALIDEVDNPIIIKKDNKIEIYDDYRE